MSELAAQIDLARRDDSVHTVDAYGAGPSHSQPAHITLDLPRAPVTLAQWMAADV